MRKERMPCTLVQDNLEKNIIVISQINKMDFESNSIYEFKLPDIYATDGTVFEGRTIKYITQPTPAYASIKDVRAQLGDIDISDEIILYHIREASRLAEVVVKRGFEKQNVSFSKEDLMELRGKVDEMRDEHWAVWEFVVYKATYESLSNLYITMATRPDKVKEMLSDLAKEYSFNLKAIKDLLDDLKKKWEEILQQFYTITDPVWGLRGKYAMPVNPSHQAPYYGLNGMGGYGRTYNSYYGGGHPTWTGRGGRY